MNIIYQNNFNIYLNFPIQTIPVSSLPGGPKSEHLCRGCYHLKLSDPVSGNLRHVHRLPGPGDGHVVRAGQLGAPGVHYGALIWQVDGDALVLYLHQ